MSAESALTDDGESILDALDIDYREMVVAEERVERAKEAHENVREMVQWPMQWDLGSGVVVARYQRVNESSRNPLDDSHVPWIVTNVTDDEVVLKTPTDWSQERVGREVFVEEVGETYELLTDDSDEPLRGY